MLKGVLFLINHYTHENKSTLYFLITKCHFNALRSISILNLRKSDSTNFDTSKILRSIVLRSTCVCIKSYALCKMSITNVSKWGASIYIIKMSKVRLVFLLGLVLLESWTTESRSTKSLELVELWNST